MSEHIEVAKGRGAPVVTVYLRYDCEDYDETLRAAIRQLEIELSRRKYKRD